MVATKAFLVSILMMPILMTGGFFVTTFLNKTGGAKERKIVVWDGTGKLFDDLKTAADQANARLDDEPEDSQNSSNGGFNQKEITVFGKKLNLMRSLIKIELPFPKKLKTAKSTHLLRFRNRSCRGNQLTQ